MKGFSLRPAHGHSWLWALGPSRAELRCGAQWTRPHLLLAQQHSLELWLCSQNQVTLSPGFWATPMSCWQFGYDEWSVELWIFHTLTLLGFYSIYAWWGLMSKYLFRLTSLPLATSEHYRRLRHPVTSLGHHVLSATLQSSGWWVAVPPSPRVKGWNHPAGSHYFTSGWRGT